VICEKSILILPGALVHKERLFFRNEGVPKYVPQVVITYGNKNIKSQWTRRNNFARRRRVAQEAKSERATFASMIASGDAIAAECVVRRLAHGEERCSKGFASRER